MNSEDNNLVDRRGFRVQIETGYKVNNISLVKAYIIPKKVEVEKIVRKNNPPVKTKENFTYKLSMNGVVLDHSYEDENFYYFDFKMIREFLRDVLPLDQESNQLIRLEEMLTYNSLCAQNAYKALLKLNNRKEIFNNNIFTNQDLEVKIITKCKNKFLDLEEEYYKSDIHSNKDN
jgi:hypothetical protein